MVICGDLCIQMFYTVERRNLDAQNLENAKIGTGSCPAQTPNSGLARAFYVTKQ